MFREALERIHETLRYHTQLLENIMSGEDDLKAAMADNAAALKDVATAVDVTVAKLVAGTSGQDPDADIAALAKELQTHTAQLRLIASNATNPQPAPVQGTGGAANPLIPPPPPAPKTAQGA